jgi:hypothetical protein
VQNHYTTENSAFNLDRNKDNRSSTADSVEYREVHSKNKLVKMTKKNWSFECVWDNQFKLVVLTKKVIGQVDQLFIGQNNQK